LTCKLSVQVSDVIKELSEGKTSKKVVELYGRTWTPPGQRIIDRNGDEQVANFNNRKWNVIMLLASNTFATLSDRC
jgi:hypothetical protein